MSSSQSRDDFGQIILVYLATMQSGESTGCTGCRGCRAQGEDGRARTRAAAREARRGRRGRRGGKSRPRRALPYRCPADTRSSKQKLKPFGACRHQVLFASSARMQLADTTRNRMRRGWYPHARLAGITCVKSMRWEASAAPLPVLSCVSRKEHAVHAGTKCFR